MKGILRKRFASEELASPRARWDRTLALTLFIGLALLVVLGLVFAVAQGSRRITRNAGILHTADESLRSATVARAQLTLALHMMSVDQETGTNSSAAVAVSTSEATEALDAFAEGVARLAEESGFGSVEISAAEFDSAGRTLLVLMSENELEASRQLAELTLAPGFDSAAAALVVARDTLADEIEASDKLLGKIGDLARFLVAFLIPAAIVFIYRSLLRRQQRQAELETRLESERVLNTAREAFIANASHELRTPLTSIVGMSLLLGETESIQADDAATELLNVIVGESDDLSRMVEDLLTTARLDAGALHFAYQDIDVEVEIAEVATPMIRSGIDLTLAVEPAIIRADRLRFRQLLKNLMSNARKYGGPSIRIEGRVERRTYVCAIVDNGDGIPEELVPRLFKRFIHQGHQTATKDSVGLGLSIVHALAHGMGGSVTHERKGGETYFSLRLPLAEAHFAMAKPSESSVGDAELMSPGVAEEVLQIAPEPG
jgi:signal transduction histidine kinase